MDVGIGTNAFYIGKTTGGDAGHEVMCSTAEATLKLLFTATATSSSNRSICRLCCITVRWLQQHELGRQRYYLLVLVTTCVSTMTVQNSYVSDLGTGDLHDCPVTLLNSTTQTTLQASIVATQSGSVQLFNNGNESSRPTAPVLITGTAKATTVENGEFLITDSVNERVLTSTLRVTIST